MTGRCAWPPVIGGDSITDGDAPGAHLLATRPTCHAHDAADDDDDAADDGHALCTNVGRLRAARVRLARLGARDSQRSLCLRALAGAAAAAAAAKASFELPLQAILYVATRVHMYSIRVHIYSVPDPQGMRVKMEIL